MNIMARISGLGQPAVFKQIWDFASYPDLCDAVRTVEILETSDRHAISKWEVIFRRGILRWTERADVTEDGQRIDFVDIDGDIDEFKGFWEIEEVEDGSVIRFSVEFDVGIPTLEHILDPIAEEALRDNTDAILRGMFESAIEIVHESP